MYATSRRTTGKWLAAAVSVAVVFSAYLYRLLRRDEMTRTPSALLLAAKHAFPAQIGAYLGTKSCRLAPLLRRFSAALDRRMSRGV